MNDLSRVSVVLPSLDPDDKLVAVVDGLLEYGFSDIILINDGSKPENLHYFHDLAAQHPEITLLHHEVNKGKGAALKNDLESRERLLESLLAEIEPLAAEMNAGIKARLLARLEEEKIPVPGDDERLLKEVLFYADKADVTEEITRLHSHFGQFRRFLAESKPVGRSLDFLMQEMFREITTLGNKAGVPAVSPLVVAFKSELEKLREQIQNVE